MNKTLIFAIFLSALFMGSSFANEDLNGDGKTNHLDRLSQQKITAPKLPAFAGGSILVDTGHGEYVTTSSCSDLFANLAGYGFTATDFNGTLTPAVLANYDVLCIGTPRGNSGVSFSNTEIAAIIDFVNKGGGLVISGDYYNPPYSDNVKANSVANNFGIFYNQDKGSPVWPVTTNFTGHPINFGVASVGYYGWCTASVVPPASFIAYASNTNQDGFAEVSEYGFGRVFSMHDWNIWSNSYVNEYDNLKWITQGFIWVSEGGVTLTTDVNTISESTGGVVNYILDAGAANAFRNYMIFGSVTGTSPGTPFPGGLVLPLNWDAFTNLVILFVNTAIFSDFMGSLDGTGFGTAQLDTLGPISPGLVGLKMWYAYPLEGPPWDFMSNPVEIEIVP